MIFSLFISDLGEGLVQVSAAVRPVLDPLILEVFLPSLVRCHLQRQTLITNILNEPSDILLNVFLAIAVDNLAGGDGDDKSKE